MRPRIALAGLFVLAVVALFGRGVGVAPAPPPPPARERPRPSPRPASAPLEPPTRNVFEYAAPKPLERALPAYVPPAPEPPTESAAPPEPPVRLLGLVRRAGTLRAALSIHGETVYVAAGETAGDYRVIAVDEDGVRLRAADGSTITLVTSGP